MNKKVWIKWVDTLSNDGWFTQKKAEKWLENDNGWVIDIGFLVKETKDYICISPSYDEVTKQYDYLKKIPKDTIKHKGYLTLTNKKYG